MPNRILRQSILDSEAVDRLTQAGENFYRRLISVVDDFGRFDARPSVLKACCYPLRLGKIRESDITRCVAECETAGLIALYTVESKPYLVLYKLGEPRAKRSKYPDPPADIGVRWNSYARTCRHTRAYVPYSDSPTYSNSSAPTPTYSPTTPAGVPNGGVVDGEYGQDSLDSEIHAYYRENNSLPLWDRKSHAKMRNLVGMVGWEGARELIVKAQGEGVGFPVGYALGMAQGQAQQSGAKSAKAFDVEANRRRIEKLMEKI